MARTRDRGRRDRSADQPPNAALNPYNATAAYLTDQIPGYTFDPSLVGQDETVTCPLDAFGNFKTPTS